MKSQEKFIKFSALVPPMGDNNDDDDNNDDNNLRELLATAVILGMRA